MERCRPEPEGSNGFGASENEVAKLRPDQRCRSKRMFAADESIPKEVLGIQSTGDEIQTQIADLVHPARQLGERWQRQAVIPQLAGAAARLQVSRRWQHDMPGLLQAAYGYIRRT